MMIGNMDLGRRGKLAWLIGAVLVGLASQYCVNYGICALPV
jgi:hypothetical protein